jgi:hypothetical protein
MDLFNADIKQFSMNYSAPVNENRIKEDLFKKIPEYLDDSETIAYRELHDYEQFKYEKNGKE